MLSLIVNKRPKIQWKTGMCKINESPCQLQLEARCFIVYFSPPRGVEWSFLQRWLVYAYFPVFTKKKKKSSCFTARGKPLRRRLHKYEMVCGCLFAEILAAQAFSILLKIWSRSCRRLSRASPQTKNNIGRSLSTSTASISSLILNSHPVHPLVREYKIAKSLNNKLNLRFIFSQKTDYFLTQNHFLSRAYMSPLRN